MYAVESTECKKVIVGGHISCKCFVSKIFPIPYYQTRFAQRNQVSTKHSPRLEIQLLLGQRHVGIRWLSLGTTGVGILCHFYSDGRFLSLNESGHQGKLLVCMVNGKEVGVTAGARRLVVNARGQAIQNLHISNV